MFEWKDASSLCSDVASHLSIHYVRHVAALAQKLHHFLGGASHLCPPGFGFWVLLKPTNLVSVEYEVHLPQSALGSHANGIALFPKLDEVSVFDESLPPNLD